jgi:hypothetical protein
MGNAEDGVAGHTGLASTAAAGMITGMTSAKVAISLPKDVLARARAAVRRGEAPTLSAYVSKVIDEKTKEDDIMAMLDEMLEETGGPPTPEESRWARGVLGIGKRHPKPKHLK